MRTDSSVLSKQNLDLIFAKVKANRVTKREMGANRIHFQQFLEVRETLKHKPISQDFI
jgi:hypothetical protein